MSREVRAAHGPKRTPVLTLLRSVAALLSRRAMVGWLLRAFALVVMGLVPLALWSSYGALSGEAANWLFLWAGSVLALAVGLYIAGNRLRKRP